MWLKCKQCIDCREVPEDCPINDMESHMVNLTRDLVTALMSKTPDPDILDRMIPIQKYLETCYVVKNDDEE